MMKISARLPGGLLRYLILVSLLTVLAPCQKPERTAKDLVSFLSYQAGRKENARVRLGLFGCGHTEDEQRSREAAQGLVETGDAAIPEIEDAFEEIEKEGEQSHAAAGAWWLLHAYASIQGPAAQERLWRMLLNSRTEFLQEGIVDSFALAHGLTSYVPSSRLFERIFRCRPDQPRDALDQFILAWERNERSSLEDTLGPRAKSALRNALGSESWEDLRVRIGVSKTRNTNAIGYHFEIPSQWSEPEETLKKNRDHHQPSMSDSFSLETQFTTKSGDACGLHSIAFDRDSAPGGLPMRFRVDETDLEGLLRVLANCLRRGE